MRNKNDLRTYFQIIPGLLTSLLGAQVGLLIHSMIRAIVVEEFRKNYAGYEKKKSALRVVRGC